MLRLLRALVVLALPFPAIAAPPAVPDWPFDVLKLKNGVTHKGLLLEENPSHVRFQIVGRAPGRPTVLFPLKFAKADVAKLDKLSDTDRETLKSKLKEIDPSPEAELRRLEKLDLKLVDWLGKKDAGLRYDSDYFSLHSDAPEEVVRRAAHRLENVYAAYANYLPPRFAGGAPTVIQVHQTLAGYQKATPGGVLLQNPAFYDPSSNRVVCGTDFQRLGDDLTAFRLGAKKDLDEIAKEEVEIIRLYGKKPDLARHLQPLKDRRATIEASARRYETVFERITRQLFQTLYHEAFHSYVSNFVYPANGKGKTDSPGELPRWLNEGMAQVFETAVFEAGELRIGHADKIRLDKAQESLAKKEFPPLKDVLTAGRDAFVIAHSGKRPEADRAYIATWALASYLMFDRRVLSSGALDEFVKSVNAGGDTLAAFEKLTGQAATEFEKDFHTWLRKLLPSGSLLETGGK